jgi:hypothetical protein
VDKRRHSRIIKRSTQSLPRQYGTSNSHSSNLSPAITTMIRLDHMRVLAAIARCFAVKPFFKK